VLNCAAILSDRTRLIPEIWTSSYNMSLDVNDQSSSLQSLPPPIVNSGLKTVSINWVSIVLNCATILLDRTRLLSQIWASSYNTYA